jgi:predicted dehydrogenase
MVLVRTAVSLVSAGTERMALDFASKNILQKARSRPDLLRQVIGKARAEGIATAIGSAFSRLDRPVSLGYSTAGTVVAVGEEVTGVRPGDRVACAGAGYAVHAEFVCVPRNLVAVIPSRGEAGLEVSSEVSSEVPFEDAAFATVGAIAMHGVRLAGMVVGETAAIIGLGLIGNLAVQLAKASGCRVLGMDPDGARAGLARQLGCDATASTSEEFAALVEQATNGLGADCVVITAATSSNAPVELAARVARGRARVVAVGAVGTELPRKPFYDKELEFVIAKSYGPGRYDPSYEEKGNDYPPQYVRWTENRNLESFLSLVAEKKVQVQPLVTHRFPIDDAVDAYDLISGKTAGPFLGVLITYPGDAKNDVLIRLQASPAAASPVAVGMLGAGNFATSVLLPAISATPGTSLVGVCAATGLSAEHAGKKFGFSYCTTDERRLVEDAGINTVVISTRHDLHARQVLAAIAAGKNVFCEKPLCLHVAELEEIARAFQQRQHSRLMVGYNRRFAPMVGRLRAFLSGVRDPLMLHYRINAGYIPASHWVQDADAGGGRILGEVCHFVDLVSFLSGSVPRRVHARSLPDGGRYVQDNVAATIEYENGALATINYAACGDKSVSKERLEVFGGGATCILDDYRQLTLARGNRSEVVKSRLRQDKGHRSEWAAFANSITRGEAPPIAFEEIVATSLTTFAIVESLRTGESVEIHLREFLNAAGSGSTRHSSERTSSERPSSERGAGEFSSEKHPSEKHRAEEFDPA